MAPIHSCQVYLIQRDIPYFQGIVVHFNLTLKICIKVRFFDLIIWKCPFKNLPLFSRLLECMYISHFHLSSLACLVGEEWNGVTCVATATWSHVTASGHLMLLSACLVLAMLLMMCWCCSWGNPPSSQQQSRTKTIRPEELFPT